MSDPRLMQIAPGVFVAPDGASQAIDNRNLPASGLPIGPLSFRRKFRGAAGSTPVYNVADFTVFNGEIILPVGLASVLVLPGPSLPRNCLGFRNSSAAACNIALAFGTPATLSSWLLLAQNTIVLLDNRPPQDDVYAICSTAAGQLTIVQSITEGSTS